MTIVTINEEVMVLGIAPRRSTYVCKRVNSLSNRRIVTIMNEREEKLTTTGGTDMKFWKTAAGAPPAMRAGFHPGDRFGQEFVYPRGLPAKIAEAAPVLTADARTEAEMKEATVTKVALSGKEEPVAVTTRATPAPTGGPLEVKEEPAPAPEPSPVAAAEM